MVVERPLILVGYLVAAALPLVLLPYVRQHRSSAGSTGMVVLVVGIALWCSSVGTLFGTTDAAIGLAAANIRLFAVYVTVGGWLLIALDHTGLARPSRTVLGLLLVPAIAVQLVAWIEPTAVWASSTFEWKWEESTLLYDTHVVYNYLIAALTLVLFAADALSSQGLRRRQGLTLFASILPPLATNAVFQIAGLQLDPTPLGLVVSVYVLAWGLFRVGFLEIVPAGRHQAMEELSDPVITIDDQGRVVDYNRAARTLVDADDGAIGQDFETFFAPVAPIADAISGDSPDSTVVTVGSGEDRRHFDLTTARVTAGNRGGCLIVLRDVTALKERERSLRESEQELTLLRQVFERTLRHNVRNEVTVLSGYAEQIQSVDDGRAADFAAEIADVSDDLADASQKARTVGRLVDRSGEPLVVDVRETVDSTIDDVESSFPAVTFSVEGPETVKAFVDPTVDVAIRNLIENAAEHNDGPEQNVSVRLEQTDDEATVTIDDDGPGIPEEELDVLETGEVTPLEHGSGLGMWIVYWVEETTDATVEFDTGSDGTIVIVRLPLLDADRTVGVTEAR